MLLNKQFIAYSLLFVSFLVPCFSNPQGKEYVIVGCERGGGFFRTVASVVGLLHLYEKGEYSGIKIDFQDKGLYYDEAHGPNWWEYFFEPLQIGSRGNEPLFFTVNGRQGCDCAMLTEFRLLRIQVNDLISKYIHVKPFIKKKVESFVKKYFRKFSVIGVHYRGTDKGIEAPRASYERAFGVISQEMKKFGWKHTKIFVATDEKEFLNAIREAFPKKVICYTNAMRSSDGLPVHKMPGNGFKKGEEALIDCLLLSRCDTIIKTSSNLSLFSTYFSPEIPVIHLTSRHGKKILE